MPDPKYMSTDRKMFVFAESAITGMPRVFQSLGRSHKPGIAEVTIRSSRPEANRVPKFRRRKGSVSSKLQVWLQEGQEAQPTRSTSKRKVLRAEGFGNGQFSREIGFGAEKHD